MKFKVESNWLLRTEEFIELDPKNFLYCANIDELNSSIEDYINDNMKYPDSLNKDYVQDMECLGVNFWDTTYGKFMSEWQKLKGLPEEF